MITSEYNLDMRSVLLLSHSLLVYFTLFVYVLPRYRFNLYLPITQHRLEGLRLMILVNNNI